ncbi:Trm112 family protein [Thalassobaculum sp.]|uniref:Trm112 family protein n=1 Tax=Thalassobaculum sp. TaxID=2022740 RepID=UPI0032ED6B6E
MSGTETGGAAAGGPSVDPKLLEILVCPITKRQLSYDREAGELISETARLAFPIRDGVPIMLVDEARSLDAEPDATDKVMP